MENKDDSPTAPPLSSTDTSNSNVHQNLPVDPSGSTASLPLDPPPPTKNLLFGFSLRSAASFPLGQSSSTVTPTPTANLLYGSSLRSAASLPLRASSSTVTPPSTTNLLFGSPLSSAASLPFGHSSSTVPTTPTANLLYGSSLRSAVASSDVDLSLGLNLPAAASTSLRQDTSLGWQDASSSINVPTKKRALHFPMTRINIGNWTQTAAYSRDLIAKCHFTTKRFVWEILSKVETDAGSRNQIKKIEIDWASVLSFKAEHDCFQIELSKPPRFRIENKDYQDTRAWKQIDHFAEDHPSSTCRRHSLFFDPQVLKTNIDKMLEDAFWSDIKNVHFPSLPSLLFSGEDQNLLEPQDNLEAATRAGEKRTYDQIS